jgi:SPP1 gp7 family putative phage head morphogenesis protein
VVETLAGANILADLVGRAQIVEEAQAEGFEFSETVDFAVAEAEFGRLAPEEAWRRFRKKLPMSKARFDQLFDEYKNAAFSIAGDFEEELIWEVKNELDRALQAGLTQKEFITNIEQLFERMGITPLKPYRIENIFRTNMMSAYNGGRWDMLQDKQVADYFPYFQYDAVNDSRTRPAHAAMDGHVARRDDPVWLTWWPPNGYQCRCTVRPVSRSEETEEKVPPRITQDEGGRKILVKPDEGFRGAPATRAERRRYIPRTFSDTKEKLNRLQERMGAGAIKIEELRREALAQQGIAGLWDPIKHAIEIDRSVARELEEAYKAFREGVWAINQEQIEALKTLYHELGHARGDQQFGAPYSFRRKLLETINDLHAWLTLDDFIRDLGGQAKQARNLTALIEHPRTGYAGSVRALRKWFQAIGIKDDEMAAMLEELNYYRATADYEDEIISLVQKRTGASADEIRQSLRRVIVDEEIIGEETAEIATSWRIKQP